MADDTTPDGTEEPTVDPDDEQDAAARGDDDQPDEDTDDDVDVAELRTRLAEAEAEAARYKRRLVASDLRKKQVEKELRETRNQQAPPKKGGDDDRPSPADEQTARENAELKRELATMRVRSDFDAITKYDWQDRGAAWKLLDLSDARQDDGTVDRDDLADAVDALAKANPYLVKPKGTPTPTGDRPTGQQPGGHRRDRTPTPDRDALVKRAPVLRGRVPV